MTEPNRHVKDPRAPSPHAGGGARKFVDDSDIGTRVLVALSKVGVSLRASAWNDATRRGLNPTQAQILSLLRRRATEGLRLQEIAAHLAVKPPTVSDSVAALVEKGLVEKKPHLEDARSVAVVLTARGRAEADELSEWPDMLLSAVGSLREDEKAVFLRALMKMIRELQVTGQIAPARICATCEYFRPDVHAGGPPHHCAFVDAPFGDANLRVDCREHRPAEPATAAKHWAGFQ
jgi:DNA-binding MarR family transcriptional regulator